MLRVWDVASGQPFGAALTGRISPVWAVATVVLDGRPVAVTGSKDGTVRVWDLASGQPLGAPFTGHTGSVGAVATVVLDGRPVAVAGSNDGTVRVWELASGQPLGEPFLVRVRVSALAAVWADDALPWMVIITDRGVVVAQLPAR
ncbi:WD domain-containing protein, G-beta repeat-containing protein [Streptomyces sp. DvalAA-14]|nr:WD domain-containing protein, G-beta repeat-containing protein [Streptomyces sp. DvalAA-14]